MLKNYTSSVSAAKSIAFIESKLAQNGAMQILKEFEFGQEVELWENNRLRNYWKHYYFIAENGWHYFLMKTDSNDVFTNGFDAVFYAVFYADYYPKGNYSTKPLKPVCEMTLDQVCEELGRNIKIIT